MKKPIPEKISTNYGISELSLDRINGDKGYEPGNLRWATQTLQNYNKKKRVDNKTGYVGISFPKDLQAYRVRVRIEGKTINVGVFKNLPRAVKSRDNFLQKHKPEQLNIRSLYHD